MSQVKEEKLITPSVRYVFHQQQHPPTHCHSNLVVVIVVSSSSSSSTLLLCDASVCRRFLVLLLLFLGEESIPRPLQSRCFVHCCKMLRHQSWCGVCVLVQARCTGLETCTHQSSHEHKGTGKFVATLAMLTEILVIAFPRFLLQWIVVQWTPQSRDHWHFGRRRWWQCSILRNNTVSNNIMDGFVRTRNHQPFHYCKKVYTTNQFSTFLSKRRGVRRWTNQTQSIASSLGMIVSIAILSWSLNI